MRARTVKTVGAVVINMIDDGFRPVTYEIRDIEGNHRGSFRSFQPALIKAERIGYSQGEYYRDSQGRISEGRG